MTHSDAINILREIEYSVNGDHPSIRDEAINTAITVDYGISYGRTTCQRFFHNKKLGWDDDCVIAWMPPL